MEEEYNKKRKEPDSEAVVEIIIEAGIAMIMN
jgi:hypothetical protein